MIPRSFGETPSHSRIALLLLLHTPAAMALPDNYGSVSGYIMVVHEIQSDTIHASRGAMITIECKFGVSRDLDGNESSDRGSITVLGDDQKWCVD
jgi:hypothetical protein